MRGPRPPRAEAAARATATAQPELTVRHTPACLPLSAGYRARRQYRSTCNCVVGCQATFLLTGCNPPPATSSLRDTHEALLTGQYLWCHKCGSYTAGRAGLQEECIPLPESWKGCSLPPRAMWKRRQDLRGGRGPVSHGRAEGPVRVDDLERKNLADGEAEGARTGGVSRTSATKCGFSPSEEEESRHGVHTTARGYQSEMTPPSTAARGTSVAPPSCVRHASAQSEPWGGECVSTRRLADRPFWTQPVGSLVALACGASTPPSRPHSPPRHQRLQHRLQRGRRDHDAEGVQKRKRVVVEAQGRALGS